MCERIAEIQVSLQEKECNFLTTLQSKLNLVYLYENMNLLKIATDMIPTEELNTKATLKLSMAENSEDSEKDSFEDFLLLELLNWFKYSFFQWIDIPMCEVCNQIPINSGTVPVNEVESLWLARTVENYFCSKCKVYIRFPRYNHPKKLLETRCGRCGEWANCFTLLCRAMGYDARIVFDWNDHVWTEVFSFSKSRWLHCDPCENICDKPLLYELGWKKPISYVIAFSKDEVQDVTWRYTSNFFETLKRRKLCREEWLVSRLLSLTKKLQKHLTLEKKNEMMKRKIIELVEFLTEPVADESLGGRTSGSMAWRLSRGEVHTAIKSNIYSFELNDEEIRNKYFCIKYCCATDKYIHVSNHLTETEYWYTYSFSFHNIIRKVELDWKMAYLAREDGYKEGSICWKFDFKNSGLVVKFLKLCLQSTVFESGSIKWIVESDQANITHFYNANEASMIQTEDFKGCTNLSISAKLSGGKGNTAWQHTQLFRQPISSEEFPFEAEIFLDTLSLMSAKK